MSHFSYRTQNELDATDLLERYRAYANERVCAPQNQRTRLPEQFLWSQTKDEQARAEVREQARKQREEAAEAERVKAEEEERAKAAEVQRAKEAAEKEQEQERSRQMSAQQSQRQDGGTEATGPRQDGGKGS